MKQKKRMWAALRFLFVCGTAAATLFPIYWMAITSFKTSNEAFSVPPVFFPPVNFSSYRAVFTELNFSRYLFNSLFVSLTTMAIGMLVSILAGYGMARFRFAGSKIVDACTLFVRMVPPVIIAIPIYIIWTKAGIADSLWGLTFAYMGLTLPLNMWMLATFIKEIPFELEEAAGMDGCSYGGILWRIIVPLIKPGISVTAILTFRTAWNEFLIAIVLTGRNNRTLPAAVSLMISDLGIDWGRITAIATVIAVPAFIITFTCSKNLISGLTAGAVKG